MNVMPTDTLSRFDAPRSRNGLRRLWENKVLLRRVLMIAGVAIVATVSLLVYLIGGRYVTTDDAYVRAAQLMVSTDVSGLVMEVNVREGQHVKAGDILFRLDPKPFQIALENAKAALATAAQNVESPKRIIAAISSRLVRKRLRLQWQRLRLIATTNLSPATQLPKRFMTSSMRRMFLRWRQ